MKRHVDAAACALCIGAAVISFGLAEPILGLWILATAVAHGRLYLERA